MIDVVFAENRPNWDFGEIVVDQGTGFYSESSFDFLMQCYRRKDKSFRARFFDRRHFRQTGEVRGFAVSIGPGKQFDMSLCLATLEYELANYTTWGRGLWHFKPDIEILGTTKY